MLLLSEIVKGCQANNPVCQEELYKRYSKRMFAVSLRYCFCREEAEDVLQEAFIRIFKHINSYKEQGSFEGWMNRIVINASLRNKYIAIKKREVNSYDGVKPIEEHSNINVNFLLAQVQKLPKISRIVFNMYAIDGYSHREIGQFLNIKECTSRSNYLRARAHLRGYLLQEKEYLERIKKNDKISECSNNI